MAKIVLGLASSHSPQLSTPSEQWQLHAERDKGNKELWFRGNVYDYDQLAEVRAADHFERQLDEDTWKDRKSTRLNSSH